MPAKSVAVSPSARVARVPVGPSKVLLDKVTEWHGVSGQLAELAAREERLRREIAAEMFPDAKRGTNRVGLGFGKDAKLTVRENYSVDREAMAQSREAIGNEELFLSVVRFEPKVSQSGFEALSDNEKAMFAAFITIKRGLPALEIVNAKRGG